MKRLIIALCGLALIACCAKNPSSGTDVPDTPTTYDVPTPAFAKGADVSWLSEMEKDGKTFQKRDFSKADCFDVLKDCGVNSIRLRVWVNPTGGWSGKEDMVKLAVRAAKAGMALMVDFHYSDFFCDPSHQAIPSQWTADQKDITKMCVHVKEHTTDVLQALKSAGITPAWIQVGNETRGGMLWPLGAIGSGSGWDNYAALYKAGYDAAKSIFPNAKVMPHLENAYKDNVWWFEELKKRGGKFDMIALSHYPQADNTTFSTTQFNNNAITQITSLHNKLNVPVMISEIGVKTPDGETAATAVMSEFMTEVKKLSYCSGVFYWEPEVYDWWKPSVYTSLGWNSYNMGAFLPGGRPSKVMEALCN